MKNRTIFAILLILLLSASFVAQAQEEEEPELICESLPDSAADLRVSYYMGEGAAYFASSNLGRAEHSFACVVEQIDPGHIPGSGYCLICIPFWNAAALIGLPALWMTFRRLRRRADRGFPISSPTPDFSAPS